MQTGTNFSESFQTIYEDDPSFLETMVNNYPASPLSLFLLLQHYKNTGDDRYTALAKKTSLHFRNPAWLNYQLSGDQLMMPLPEKNVKEEEIMSNLSEEEETLESMDTEDFQPETEADTTKSTHTENEVEEEAIQEMEQEEKVEFVQGENIAGMEDSFVENEKEEEKIEEESAKEELAVQEEVEDESVIEEDHDLEEYNSAEVEEKKQDEDNDDTNSEVSVPMQDSGQPDVSSPKETRPVESGLEQNDSLSPEITDSNSELKNQQELKENQEIEFEPLHTIDYFASQGIIIREEALMDDKLGKQVKSFTDWLKSMKKLHPGKLPEQNEVVERIIQSSAEMSNEDAGILTESMAEVLLKQGKKEKAIEMFEKLSLMNPSKSTYFAAKIESLKNK